VRVEAAGVSFAEQQMRRGKYYDQPRFPFVPGYDLVREFPLAPAAEALRYAETGGITGKVVLVP
jgi:NADPH:quinone reductase-like Zn-dependent oxidoreductase